MAKFHVAVARISGQYVSKRSPVPIEAAVVTVTAAAVSWAGAVPSGAGKSWVITPLDSDGWVNFDGVAVVGVGWPVFKGKEYVFDASGGDIPSIFQVASA